jgi:hypothetical protein
MNCLAFKNTQVINFTLSQDDLLSHFWKALDKTI